MNTNEMIKILEAFSRYVNYINNHGYDEMVNEIKVFFDYLLITMRGHFGETYKFKVSIENNELIIKNAETNENIFEYLKEYEITYKTLNYIRFGE